MATGDISGSLDRLKIEESYAFDGWPGPIVPVNNNVYACTYAQDDESLNYPGYLVTFGMGTTGNLSVIDYYRLENRVGGTGRVRNPFLLHISGSLFSVVFGTQDAEDNHIGKIATIYIGPTGVIDKSGSSTGGWEGFKEFPGLTVNDPLPRAVKLKGVYPTAFPPHPTTGYFVALVHYASVTTSSIRVFEIIPGGIVSTQKDSQVIDSTWCTFPHITQLSGGYIATIYGADSLTAARCRTWKINTDGTINNTYIDTFDYDTVPARGPGIYDSGSHVFMAGHGGHLKTFLIDPSGAIDTVTGVVGDLALSNNTGVPVTPISGNWYAAIYADGTNYNVKAITFQVSGSGNISNIKDTFVVNENYSQPPAVYYAGDNKLLTVFCDAVSGEGNGYIESIALQGFESPAGPIIVQEDISSDANIIATAQDDITSNSNIRVTDQEDIISNANICVTDQGDITSNSNIEVIDLSNRLSDAWVVGVHHVLIISNAHIWTTGRKDIISDSNIQITGQEDIISSASIQALGQEDIFSAANIIATAQEDIISNSNIQVTGQEDITSNAIIAGTNQIYITSDAKIVPPNTENARLEVQSRMRQIKATPLWDKREGFEIF